MTGPKCTSGTSLLELITIIALVAIVISFGVPQIESWRNNANHRVTLTSYQELFSFARWMAASERTVVTLCPLSGAGSCIDDWNRDIAVFPDENRDKKPDQGVVWRVFPRASDSFTIKSRTAGRGYFRFSTSGMASGALGSLVVCPIDYSNVRNMSYLALNMGGRLRVLLDEDRDGEIRLPWGTIITCQ